jgi:hypothetical protein
LVVTLHSLPDSFIICFVNQALTSKRKTESQNELYSPISFQLIVLNMSAQTKPSRISQRYSSDTQFAVPMSVFNQDLLKLEKSGSSSGHKSSTPGIRRSGSRSSKRAVSHIFLRPCECSLPFWQRQYVHNFPVQSQERYPFLSSIKGSYLLLQSSSLMTALPRVVSDGHRLTQPYSRATTEQSPRTLLPSLILHPVFQRYISVQGRAWVRYRLVVLAKVRYTSSVENSRA